MAHLMLLNTRNVHQLNVGHQKMMKCGQIPIMPIPMPLWRWTLAQSIRMSLDDCTSELNIHCQQLDVGISRYKHGPNGPKYANLSIPYKE